MRQIGTSPILKRSYVLRPVCHRCVGWPRFQFGLRHVRKLRYDIVSFHSFSCYIYARGFLHFYSGIDLPDHTFEWQKWRWIDFKIVQALPDNIMNEVRQRGTPPVELYIGNIHKLPWPVSFDILKNHCLSH